LPKTNAYSNNNMPKKGIDQIFDNVYVSECKRLSGFVHKRLNNMHDAEDIIQEVWMRLHTTLREQYIHSPKAWVYTVARNKIIDYHRKKTKLILLIDQNKEHGDSTSSLKQRLQTTDSYETEVSDEMIWQAINKAMENLSAKHREAIIEIDINQKTYKELAQESNTNMGTWLSRNHYAKQKLQKYLRYFYEEFLRNM